MMLENVTKGERLILVCHGEQYLAQVSLASPNGRSLALTFNALVDGHLGMMLVFADEGGSYSSLLTGTPITLRRPSGDSEVATLQRNEK